MPAPWLQTLAIVPADEKADAALLEGIADWCDRFTPLVSLDAPDGLFLDITGAAHLFGGEDSDAGDRHRQIARQGFAVQGAIAGTSLAAHALARYMANASALSNFTALAAKRRLSRRCPSRRWSATTGHCAPCAMPASRPWAWWPAGCAANCRNGWAPVSSPG